MLKIFTRKGTKSVLRAISNSTNKERKNIASTLIITIVTFYLTKIKTEKKAFKITNKNNNKVLKRYNIKNCLKNNNKVS